jgi:hypothetical protein
MDSYMFELVRTLGFIPSNVVIVSDNALNSNTPACVGRRKSRGGDLFTGYAVAEQLRESSSCTSRRVCRRETLAASEKQGHQGSCKNAVPLRSNLDSSKIPEMRHEGGGSHITLISTSTMNLKKKHATHLHRNKIRKGKPHHFWRPHLKLLTCQHSFP